MDPSKVLNSVVDDFGKEIQVGLQMDAVEYLLNFIERRTFNYANHINLISGGFKEYFQKYKNSTFSFYSNGIDDEFLIENNTALNNNSISSKKIIVYAGNLGEGQGLHKIVPQTAKLLGNKFEFLIMNDFSTHNS